MSPFLAQIKDIYQDLDAINIHQMHQAYPMSLIEHVHQTKINLFESLRAWLDEEIVAETWIDAYQVMRDDEHLNKDLDYLMTSLTYDNETHNLVKHWRKIYMVKPSMQVYRDSKDINSVHLNTTLHMAYDSMNVQNMNYRTLI